VKSKMWVGRKNVVKPITLVSITMLLLSLFIVQISAVTILKTPKNEIINVTSGETFRLEYKIRFDKPEDGFFTINFYWDNNESLPDASKWNFTYESFVAKFTDGTGFSVPLTVTIIEGPAPSLPGVYRYLVSIATGGTGESKNGDFWVNITMRAAGQSGGSYINHAAGDHNITIFQTVGAEDIVVIEPEGQCKIHISPIPVPMIPTVYVRPATITATAAGQSFTVDIRIDNVTDLYSWSIGLTWNSSVLECTSFMEGPFLKSGGPTISMPGTINNTAGEIYPAYTYTLKEVPTGVSGSGTLANATFRSKSPGTFNVHLAEVLLLNSKLEMVPANIVGVFTVIWDSVAYHVVTLNNLTIEVSGRCRIYNYAFNQAEKMISFNVTGPDGMAGFCNVTIPKALLSANETHPWVVSLDGSPIDYIKAENATHTFIYFVYTLSIHEVQIIGSWVIPLRPPTYTLTISVTAGGTTNPSPGTYTYTAGIVVQVLATPYTNYLFDHWLLDGISNVSNPINVTMNTNHTLQAFFVSLPGPSIHITPIGETINVTSGETFTLVYKFCFNQSEKGVFATTIYWDNNESLPDASKWNFTYIGFVAKFTDGTDFWGPVTATMWKSVPSGYPPGYYRYSVTISESYGETKNGDFWVNVTMRAAGQSGGAYINHTAPSYQNITIRSTFIAEASLVTVPDGVCTIHVTPAPIRDVAIIGVSLFRTVVGEGIPTAFTEIYVTAENQGNLTETFDVTAYYDSKVIVTQTGVTLDAGCNVTLTFIWYTAYVKKGHYTIKAVATVVPGELDTADNTFVNGPFIVTIPGDIDGDGYVYTKDLGMLGKAWRTRRGDPRYNPNADIDCDGTIYVKDLAWIGKNWRKRV